MNKEKPQITTQEQFDHVKEQLDKMLTHNTGVSNRIVRTIKFIEDAIDAGAKISLEIKIGEGPIATLKHLVVSDQAFKGFIDAERNKALSNAKESKKQHAKEIKELNRITKIEDVVIPGVNDEPLKKA